MSDCGACIGADYDGESAEFYEADTITARKVHACCECGTAINPGDRYERVTGRWYGAIERHKTCLTCVSVRVGLDCGDSGVAHGFLWEEIEDYVLPKMTTGCLSKVESAAGRQALVNRWNEWRFEGSAK